MDKARRDFLMTGAGATAGAALLASCQTTRPEFVRAPMVTPPKSPNETIRVACVGIRGRGRSHIEGFQGLPNVEVVALSDIDERILDERVEQFTNKYKRKPRAEWDFRKLLEDPTIDVMTFATPNHWHALGTVWACQAGKDVYVEKPASHNIFEGRKAVEASRKYNRIVQYGVQLRSSPAIQEAVEHLRKGTIGTVYMARGLCYRWRGTIGVKQQVPVPPGVHYDMWLGPAPKQPFHENRFHYNWHYMWDFGNGDLGNQGVHEMDMCMWGLGVKFPSEVCTMAGMYIWPDDDKEIPNLSTSCFRYPKENVEIEFEVRPWITNEEMGARVGNLFYGSEGILVIRGYDTYQIYFDPERNGKLEEGPGRREGGNHYANFIKAVRSRNRADQNADIESGHYSAGLCHLGLIAHRVKRHLKFDPEKEKFIDDKEADKYLTRKYRKPYVVPKEV